MITFQSSLKKVSLWSTVWKATFDSKSVEPVFKLNLVNSESQSNANAISNCILRANANSNCKLAVHLEIKLGQFIKFH